MFTKIKNSVYKYFKKPYTVVCDASLYKTYTSSPAEKIHHEKGLLAAKRKKKECERHTPRARIKILEGHINWK